MLIVGTAYRVSLQPIRQRKTYADAVLIHIVINQTLAIAGEAQDISLEIFIVPEGEIPGTLNRLLLIKADCTCKEIFSKVLRN